MKIIENRCAFIVKPKKAFAVWVNSHDDEPIDENQILQSKSIYLIAPIQLPDEEVLQDLIDLHYLKIIAGEASQWYDDPSYLPKNVGPELVNKWFEIEIIETCFDLGTKKIKAKNYF